MEFGTITSRQNQTVRQAAALARSGEKRREKRQFLCEGARLCQDAALSGLPVELCFVTEQAREKYGDYLRLVLSACREAYLVEEHVAQLLSSTKASQGVFCVCGWPKGLLPESAWKPEQAPLLVLENLQDPGNLGTVFRTAEALGVGQAVLLGECCDPLSPKVLRSSMGAVFRMKLRAERDSGKLCKLIKEQGFTLHAAVPDASARQVTEIDFHGGQHAVVIGNEGNGLTAETIALCHDSVTIPMTGRAESLNASAAATILLWEMRREAVEREGEANG